MVATLQNVSPTVANVACIVFAFIYVAGFYLFRDEKSAKLSRNHPVTIRNRIKAVTFASIITPCLVWLIVLSHPFNVRQYSKSEFGRILKAEKAFDSASSRAMVTSFSS